MIPGRSRNVLVGFAGDVDFDSQVKSTQNLPNASSRSLLVSVIGASILPLNIAPVKTGM